MAYITTAVADEIINDSGNTLGWGGLSATEKEAFVQRASNRIEVIPFADDEQTYNTRPRFTNGVQTNTSTPIPKPIEIAVATLAVWYARNPNQGYHQPSPDASEDRSPLRDLPMSVRNALIPFLTASLRSAEQVSAPSVTEGGSALAYSDEEVAADTPQTPSGPVTIPDGSITTAKLADGAVNRSKVAPNAIDALRILDGSIGNAELLFLTPKADDQIVTISGSGFAASNRTPGISISAGTNISTTTAGTVVTINATATSGAAISISAGANIGTSVSGSVVTISATTSSVKGINAGTNVTTATDSSGVVTISAAGTGGGGGTPGNNSVGPAQLQTNAVTTPKIAAGAVTAAKIASNSITSTQIATAAIGSAEIGSNAVTSGKIASGAVDTSELAENAVTNAKIADNAVDSEQIVADAVGHTELNVSAGSNITFSTASNGLLTISAAGGGSGTPADGSITTAKLATHAVTYAKIAAQAVSHYNIKNGSIRGEDLNITGTPNDGDLVGLGTPKAQQFQAVRLVAGTNVTITPALSSGVRTLTFSASGGGGGGGNIPDGAVTTVKIADRAVTHGKIAQLSINVNQILWSHNDGNDYTLPSEVGFVKWIKAGTNNNDSRFVSKASLTFSDLSGTLIATRAQALAGTSSTTLATAERVHDAIKHLSLNYTSDGWTREVGGSSDPGNADKVAGIAYQQTIGTDYSYFYFYFALESDRDAMFDEIQDGDVLALRKDGVTVSYLINLHAGGLRKTYNALQGTYSIDSVRVNRSAHVIGGTWPAGTTTTGVEILLGGAIFNTSLHTRPINDAEVTTAKIANNAVTEAKIADGAVTAEKIGADEVGAWQLNIAAGSNITLGTTNNVLTISASGGGSISFATQTEANAGTITNKAINPATLKGALENGVYVAQYVGFQLQATGALTAGKFRIENNGNRGRWLAHSQTEHDEVYPKFLKDKYFIMTNSLGQRIEAGFSSVATVENANTAWPEIVCNLTSHHATPANPVTTGDWTLDLIPEQNKAIFETAPQGSILPIAIEGGVPPIPPKAAVGQVGRSRMKAHSGNVNNAWGAMPRQSSGADLSDITDTYLTITPTAASKKLLLTVTGKSGWTGDFDNACDLKLQIAAATNPSDSDFSDVSGTLTTYAFNPGREERGDPVLLWRAEIDAGNNGTRHYRIVMRRQQQNGSGNSGTGRSNPDLSFSAFMFTAEELT